MQDTYVELQEIPVMRVKADLKGSGPAAAFTLLESKLPMLRGRKFYGVFRITPEGIEEYYSCVARIESDAPDNMKLETAVIPGGRYFRRKVMKWEQVIRDGKLPRIFHDLASSKEVDSTRPSIEYYRSHEELQLLVPVR